MRTYKKWELSVAPKNYNGSSNVNFKSIEVPCSELKEKLISSNYSTIHWSGNRLSDNFKKATGFMIDVDCGLKIEAAVKRLKRNNLNFALITSRSHSQENHKYHIIIPSQYPIFSVDAYCPIEREIIKKVFPESDHSVKDAARYFFGSREDAEFQIDTSGMDYPIIDENIWDDGLTVKDKNNTEIQAGSSKQHTRIYCPFHNDSTPSAFIDYSTKSSNHYISCSSCNQTFWKRIKCTSSDDMGHN